MEGLVTKEFWQGRRVFLTGHTGFKGGWLSLWLSQMGAEVHGYSLNPPKALNFFDQVLTSGDFASDTRADINDLPALRTAMEAAQPEIVFHLAAQPLVRAGYRDPLGTYKTNVLGTAHVLEAGRSVESLRANLIITTDKCYRNPETNKPFHEEDPLGGHDPYSASKACAEIVTESYRRSYQNCAIATARAGNVIGGGDWAEERLIPDCIRAFGEGQPVVLRNPHATRPWQHVLEPLAGYLLLGEALLGEHPGEFARAYNFGPDAGGTATVGEVAALAARLWGKNAVVQMTQGEKGPHEASFLRLESALSRRTLGWRPKWSLEETLNETINWYQTFQEGNTTIRDFSLGQIASYQKHNYE